MNPRTQANVMVPAFNLDTETGESASGHPFVYARILGVFHTEIFHSTIGHRPVPHTLEFLWVRWYRIDRTYRAGFKARRLHRIELVPEDDPNAFGFLDPDDVIRGVHLIPAFAQGTIEETSEYPGDEHLWKFYYVNLCVHSYRCDLFNTKYH